MHENAAVMRRGGVKFTFIFAGYPGDGGVSAVADEGGGIGGDSNNDNSDDDDGDKKQGHVAIHPAPARCQAASDPARARGPRPLSLTHQTFTAPLPT